MSEESTQGSPSKSLGLNLSWTAFGELMFAGTSLLVLILLGKYGSAEVLGAYTYAMALVTPAIIFTNLHLRPAFVVEPEGQWRYGHYLALRSMLAPLVLLGAAAFAALGSHAASVASILVAMALFRVAESMADVVLAKPQREENFARIGVSRAARGGSFLLGVVVGLFAFDDAALGVWLGAGANLLLTLTYDLSTLRRYGGYRPEFEASALRSLAWRTLPMGLGAGLLNLGMSLPAYVMEAEHPLATVGQFGVLLSVLSAGGVVNVIVGNASIPRLARRAWSDPAAFRRTLAKLVGLVVLAHLLIIGGLYLLGSYYLRLYGPEFSGLETELWLAAGVGLVGGITNIVSQAVTAMGRFRAQMVINGCALVPTLVLALWWIPSEPLRGALGVLAFLSTVRGIAYLGLVISGKTVAGSSSGE